MGGTMFLALFLDKTTKEYYGPIFIPSICTTVLFSTTFLNAGPYIVQMKQARVYEIFGLLGMKPFKIQIGLIVSRWFLCCTQLLLLFLFGVLMFHLGSVKRIFFMIPYTLFVIGLAAFVSFQLSVMLTLLVKTREGAHSIGLLGFYLLISLGGCFYDIETVPEWLTQIAYAIPTFNINSLFSFTFGSCKHCFESLLILVMYGLVTTLINMAYFDFRAKQY